MVPSGSFVEVCANRATFKSCNPAVDVPAPDAGMPVPGSRSVTVTVTVVFVPIGTLVGFKAVTKVVVARRVIDCVRDSDPPSKLQELESHALKLTSPLYWNVSACEPTFSTAIANIALDDPFTSDTNVALPISVLPSLKITVPVGNVVVRGSAMVAVKVICAPKVDGFAEESRDAFGVTAAFA